MTTTRIIIFDNPADYPVTLRADMHAIRTNGQNGWTVENAVQNACFTAPGGTPGSSAFQDAVDLIQASAHIVLETPCEERDCDGHLDPRESHAASAGVCIDCMDFYEAENGHSDNGHDADNVDPDCLVCQKEAVAA